MRFCKAAHTKGATRDVTVRGKVRRVLSTTHPTATMGTGCPTRQRGTTRGRKRSAPSKQGRGVGPRKVSGASVGCVHRLNCKITTRVVGGQVPPRTPCDKATSPGFRRSSRMRHGHRASSTTAQGSAKGGVGLISGAPGAWLTFDCSHAEAICPSCVAVNPTEIAIGNNVTKP